MRKIVVEKRAINRKEFKLHAAQAGDYGELITESCSITPPGKTEPTLVYLELGSSPAMEAARAALGRVEYWERYRTDGLKTRSRVFGYSPRNVLRHDYCMATSMSTAQPAEHTTVTGLAELCAAEYARWSPATFSYHMQQSQKVLADLRLGATPFTSGIINENNPLKYHLDSGNFKNTWSAMLVWKRSIEGGHLSLPEYSLGLELKDCSLLLFDGQDTIHGVTPIRKTRTDAKRYSVVYYSLAQMWNCLPMDQEVARIQRLRTERENKLVERDRKRKGTSDV